jgi:hypothetical protein
MKKVWAPFIASLLLFMLVFPQLALAAGPAISSVIPIPSSITASSATIVWTTNTSSDSRVNYGTTKPKDGTWNSVHDSAEVTTHIVDLTGLTAATTYYFEVESTDVSGTATDNNSNAYYDFTTGPPQYSITLDHACGVCGDLVEAGVCGEIIEVTATVAAAGTYYICWDSRSQANMVATFTVGGPDVYIVTFFMPEAKKGIHNVYLATASYGDPGGNPYAPFEVLPSVKIDPEEGPVGTTVNLDFHGFAASQDLRVTLVQGTVQKGEVKTGTANSVGSWTTTYTIPHTPAGSYNFKIEGKEGTDLWVNWVNKYFKVLPEIAITPSSGTVGLRVKVEGTGFASEEAGVKITFDGEVRKEDPLVDAAGSWTDWITVPVRTCGRYNIDASGSTTRARDVEDVTFTLVAGIVVDPISGYVDDTIAVTGGGFAPEETGIRVSFGTTVVTTATITADIYGCWESYFDLPASTYGSHTVSASGATTAAVTATLDTKAKIEEYSPDEGPRGDTVSLTGSGFRGSQTLTVTVGGVAATESLQTRSNGDVVISFRVPKCTLGEQTLRVTDGEATAEVDFTVTEKVLATPLRISPEDSKLRSGTVTFSWHSITGGNGITYIVEISSDSAFRSGLVSEPAGGTTELVYTLPNDKALGNGTYYWRVRAVDNYGNESAFSASDYSTFTVSLIPTWVWVVVGLVVLVVLLVVAYRETKFRVTE